MELTTNRLLLRPIAAADREAVFAYRSDREANKFQGWIPASLEEVDAFVERNPADFNLAETWFQLVVILRQTGKIIGDVGVHFMGRANQQAEIGCTLSQAAQHQGFATEALEAVIDTLFTVLHKHRISCSIDPDNATSRRLVERLGFRQEAHFVQSLWLNGAWRDDLVYALLKKDWNKTEPC